MVDDFQGFRDPDDPEGPRPKATDRRAKQRGAGKPRQDRDAASASPSDWTRELALDERGQPLSNLANVMIALRRAPELVDAFAHDEMQCADVLLRPLPTVATPRKPAPLDPQNRIGDLDISQLQEWLQRRALFRVNRDTVNEAVSLYSNERRFHPIRDYLDALAWDGKPRVQGWLTYYFGVDPGEYSSAVGRMFLVALIARIYEPGCKVDHLLILEGPQGLLKSTAIKVLAGGERWFSDSLPKLHAGKDVSQHLSGKWITEIAELASIRKSEVEDLNAFLSRQIERYRAPYGRREVFQPRQGVFVGTTNADKYLDDPTGGRRFWPVKCATIDIRSLANDRDQLLAEAVALYRRGLKWWPDADLERRVFRPQQRLRRVDDEWITKIAAYLNRSVSVTLTDIYLDALGGAADRFGTRDQRRVRDIIMDLGWQHDERSGTRRTWIRTAPERPELDFNDAHDAHDALSNEFHAGARPRNTTP